MSIFRTIFPTLAGTVLLLAQTAGQQPPPQQKAGQPRNPDGAPPATLAANEREFLLKTATNGRKEVAMARLATQKSTNADVKKFAQTLVDDHTRANQEIEDLAKRKGVTIPAESTASPARGEPSKAGPPASSPAHMEQLSKLSGEQFDKAFIQRMVESHTKSVAEFERQSKNATDNDIRTLTAKLLPTLKEHLEQARTLNKSLSGSKTKSIGE